jgi:Tfp pilus assembly protein FimT
MKRSQQEYGFAGLEAVLVIVIIGIVAGVGYWVFTQRKDTTSQSVTSSAAPASTIKAVDPSKNGTVEGIDQLTQADGASEATINQQYGASDQSAAMSSTAAQNSVGGAYNESSF